MEVFIYVTCEDGTADNCGDKWDIFKPGSRKVLNLLLNTFFSLNFYHFKFRQWLPECAPFTFRAPTNYG